MPSTSSKTKTNIRKIRSCCHNVDKVDSQKVFLPIGRHSSCSGNFSLSIHFDMLHVAAQVKSSSPLNQSITQLSQSGAPCTITAKMFTEFKILEHSILQIKLFEYQTSFKSNNLTCFQNSNHGYYRYYHITWYYLLWQQVARDRHRGSLVQLLNNNKYIKCVLHRCEYYNLFVQMSEFRLIFLLTIQVKRF